MCMGFSEALKEDWSVEVQLPAMFFLLRNTVPWGVSNDAGLLHIRSMSLLLWLTDCLAEGKCSGELSPVPLVHPLILSQKEKSSCPMAERMSRGEKSFLLPLSKGMDLFHMNI